MVAGLINDYQLFKKYFEDESSKYFAVQTKEQPALEVLWNSMQYTYFLEGKRFRPFLTFLVSQCFKKSFDAVFPLGLAVECIHTYSLIHDDLPCLDNDDFRRGKPSNHKVYGEDVALLSGDALLTEAFHIMASMKNAEASDIVKTIQLMSQKTGPHGMVGGQVLDMKVTSAVTLSQLETIHLLKTANLIEVSVVGAAILLKANEAQLKHFSVFARQLGIAFQIKDDLLDGLESNQDYKNYIQIIGLEKTHSELQKKSDLALKALQQIDLDTSSLQKIIQFNLDRTK